MALNYNMKLNDIIEAFADLEEDLSKVPDTLDALPVGTNMYAVLRETAQYYIDKFTEIRDQIEV